MTNSVMMRMLSSTSRVRLWPKPPLGSVLWGRDSRSSRVARAEPKNSLKRSMLVRVISVPASVFLGFSKPWQCTCEFSCVQRRRVAEVADRCMQQLALGLSLR